MTVTERVEVFAGAEMEPGASVILEIGAPLSQRQKALSALRRHVWHLLE